MRLASWSEWAWNTFIYDPSGESEAVRVNTWKQVKREHEEWEAWSNRGLLKRREEIRRLKQEIEPEDLKRRQLSGKRMQQEMEKFESDERKARSDLFGMILELDELEERMNALTISVSQENELLEVLVGYPTCSATRSKG